MSEHRVHLFVKITDWLITAITALLAYPWGNIFHGKNVDGADFRSVRL
jgi:hypothetical protein